MSNSEAQMYKDELLRYKLIEILTEDDNPLKEEHRILNFFRANWETNPKKVIKLMQRYVRENPDLPNYILNGIVAPTLRAKDPAEALRGCFEYQAAFGQMVRQMFDNGFHGFITTGDLCYGVKVISDVPLTPDDKYSPDEERELQRSLMLEWSKTHSMKENRVSVLLFQEYGFTGISRMFDFDL